MPKVTVLLSVFLNAFVAKNRAVEKSKKPSTQMESF